MFGTSVSQIKKAVIGHGLFGFSAENKKAAENWKDSPRLAICITQEPTGRRTPPSRSATTNN
jgi:hypothetical protein